MLALWQCKGGEGYGARSLMFMQMGWRLFLLILIPPCLLFSEENVYVPAGQVVEGNFLKGGRVISLEGHFLKDVIVGGREVNIGGTVEGDVIAVGEEVRISAVVKGGVIAMGRYVALNGTILGSARAMGERVDVKGKIGRNANLLGRSISVSQDSQIGWDLAVGGEDVHIGGKVEGDIRGGGKDVSLNCQVGGDAHLRIGELGALVLLGNTDIKGNLDYSAPQQARLEPGARVEGKITYTPFVPPPKRKAVPLPFKVFGLLVSFLLSLILVLLFPKQARVVTDRMLAKPWASLGLGWVYLIVIPISAILITITIIGIPLSLLLLFFYLFLLYLSVLFLGIATGRGILRVIFKRDISLVWGMLLGLILLFFLRQVPILSLLILLLGGCWALGALCESLREAWSREFRSREGGG